MILSRDTIIQVIKRKQDVAESKLYSRPYTAYYDGIVDACKELLDEIEGSDGT